MPKIIPPEEAQLPNESRKFWGGVTEAIVTKQYSLATTRKQELEERQREKAAERKEKASEWQPRFFSNATDANGKPDLTEEGRLALDGLHKGEYKLEESKELGA